MHTSTQFLRHRRLACTWIAGYLLAAGLDRAAELTAQDVGASTNTQAVPLSMIDAAWDSHLADINDPKNREWKLRARLERNPMDREAIEGLITHYWGRGERAMAVSALQYAVHAGLTDNTKAHKVWAAENVRIAERNAQGKRESDPYVEVRMKWFEETLAAGKKLPVLMKVYGDMERETRDLFHKSDQQQQLLHAIARQYQHHGEWSMAAMTALSALRLEPANEELIEHALDILAQPGYERLLEEMIRSYAQRDDLKPPQVKRLIALSEARELNPEIVAFYRQAVQLDPYNPLYWQRIGEALFAQRKYREAIIALEHAAKLADHDISIYHTLAVILHHSGDERNMVYWLQRWRNKVDEDQLVEALLSKPFNAYPKLLFQLE